MAYVDLNPVRAGMADTPEASDFTSVQHRIDHTCKKTGSSKRSDSKQTTSASKEQTRPNLMTFGGRMDQPDELPFSLNDYLELVDWSGRAIHPHKPGYIPEHYPKILERMELNPDALLTYLGRKDRDFHHVIGRPLAIRQAAAELGKKFLQGITAAQRLFPQRI